MTLDPNDGYFYESYGTVSTYWYGFYTAAVVVFLRSPGSHSTCWYLVLREPTELACVTGNCLPDNARRIHLTKSTTRKSSSSVILYHEVHVLNHRRLCAGRLLCPCYCSHPRRQARSLEGGRVWIRHRHHQPCEHCGQME